MQKAIWLAFFPLAACAPPPEVETTEQPVEEVGTPTITILYPTLEVGQSTLEIPIDSDGIFRTIVVVHIENLEFIKGVSQDAENQGHWHLFVNNKYISPTSQSFELDSSLSEFSSIPFAPGEIIEISATLQDNTHDDIPGAINDRIEVRIGEPTDTGFSASQSDSGGQDSPADSGSQASYAI